MFAGIALNPNGGFARLGEGRQFPDAILKTYKLPQSTFKSTTHIHLLRTANTNFNLCQQLLNFITETPCAVPPQLLTHTLTTTPITSCLPFARQRVQQRWRAASPGKKMIHLKASAPPSHTCPPCR